MCMQWGWNPGSNSLVVFRYDESANPIIASNKLIEYCNSKGITAERLYGEKELLYEMEAVM